MADNVVNVVLPSTGLTISQWVNEITTIDCTSALTAAINCENSSTFVVNLYADSDPHTFTLTNLKIGQTVKITIVQGSTTSTVTWGGTGNQAIRWTGGTAPTLSTTASNADMILLYGAAGTSPPTANLIGGTLALANF